MNNFITQELFNVARQAIEYVRESGNKPKFIEQADNVLTVFRAVQIGGTVGREQGWDVFEIGGGYWSVQADDDLDMIDDIEAISLACKAGIKVNATGDLLDKSGNKISIGESLCCKS